MKKQNEYVLVNANEEIIKLVAKDLMKQTDMCRCEKCYLDVCALTLNNISSHYVTSRTGQIINNAIKDTAESKIEIVVAVSRAIEIVKGSPKHLENEPIEPKASVKNVN